MFDVVISVTRFGNILRIFVKLVEGLFSVWQILEPTYFGKIVMFGEPFNIVHGQLLKNNTAIWSHWL